jgi:hypothetical protein
VSGEVLSAVGNDAVAVFDDIRIGASKDDLMLELSCT